MLYTVRPCWLSILNRAVVFPSGSVVKNLSAMLESWVQSAGQEDSPEKGMATHSSILVWKIPWTEELVGYSHGITRVGHDLVTKPL